MKWIGKLIENTKYGGKKYLEEIYVIERLHTCLLGKPSLKSFRLGPNIHPEIACSIRSFVPLREFPSSFQRLGLLKGVYRIELKGDVKPYALTSPCRIAITRENKVRNTENATTKCNHICRKI